MIGQRKINCFWFKIAGQSAESGIFKTHAFSCETMNSSV